MALIYLNVECSKCGSDSVMSNYNEKVNDIECNCLNCGTKGFLKDFNYLVDGDTEL